MSEETVTTAFSAIVEEDPTNDGNFLYPFPEDIIFKELIPPFAFLDVVEYSSISHSDGKYENLSGSFSKINQMLLLQLQKQL